MTERDIIKYINDSANYYKWFFRSLGETIVKRSQKKELFPLCKYKESKK